MPLAPLKPELTPENAFHTVMGTVVWSGLFSALVGINGMQMASLAVKPFSGRAFRRFNRFAANTWWGATVIGAEKMHGFTLELYGDDVPDEENAIVICNHQQMTDIPMIMTLAMRKGRLGDLKFFVKDVIKWVPGVGWGMHFLNMVFLKRDWSKDKESVVRTFASLVDDKVPAWLVIFTEGTRIQPHKLEKSNRFAEKAGLEPTRHVLLPRPKGFAAAVQGMRGHATAVYDLTIGYEEGVPSLRHFVTGAVRNVQMHIKRHEMSEMPYEEEELGEWLRARFYEKDQRLEHFYATGRLDEGPSRKVQAG